MSSTSRSQGLSTFAGLVRLCREEAGYPSARHFYRAHGREHLGCTYKAYQNMERGLSVPSPALVERLATALRVGMREERLREFAAAYLKILLGPGDFLEFAVSALSGVPQDVSSIAPRESREMTPEQSRVTHASRESYWCFAVLSSDEGTWSAEDLSELSALDPAALKAALDSLSRAGIISRAGRGRYSGRDFALAENVTPRIKDYWNAFGEGETVLLEHPLLIRAGESDMRNYFAYLNRSLECVRGQATRAKGPDTALFAVELSLKKLFSF